ncbi:MAG: glycosyltransferase [Deltaproteobacteria bacterium]|nr:glycosyltransferase [Deltaproteobacteria bacterium]
MQQVNNNNGSVRPLISVVAPCFNESGNLYELTLRTAKVFEKHEIPGELILVNDGSTDNTAEVMEDLSRRFNILRTVHHAENKGIEHGWRSGVEAARGDYVCLIDADLQNPPEDIWRLYREIKHTRTDMVQGCRSSIGRLKDSRFILSKGLNLLLNILFGMRAKDNKSGFVLARRDLFQEIFSHSGRYFYWQSFIRVAAESRGFRVSEVETLFESRQVGTSFMSQVPVKVILRCLWDLAVGFKEYRLGARVGPLASYLKRNKAVPVMNDLEWWRRALFSFYVLCMPLHKWKITRRAGRYYKELRESQWLSREQILDYQNERLKQLIRHAYEHVPFYRERFDNLGLIPSDIKSVDDLGKIPVLDKKTFKDNLYFDLFSSNHDKREILRVATSGSTGEPFVCYADRFQLEMRWAATLRSMEWAGYRFGDRQARLWHQTLGMSTTQVLRERLDALFCRRLFIPAFELSDANIGSMIDKLERYKPSFIDGYAESFNFLSRYFSERPPSNFRLKGIMSSAQILPEQSRAIIERAFNCKVFDKYGSREFSGIAYECEAHEGHHVVAENYIVEILKNGVAAKDGEMGEIIITDLNNYCVPFIRYRLGDLAMAMDDSVLCGCGRALPRIGRIEGRTQAIVVGANGNYLPGTFFAHLFKDFDHAVAQYQIVQEKVGAITLKIVKAPRFTDSAFGEILALLRQYLGESTNITVEFVETIPLIRTGKHQGVISRLDLDFQNLTSIGINEAPRV